MKILILYSSVTGNTRKLAQSIQSEEHGITCLGIEEYIRINVAKTSVRQNMRHPDSPLSQNPFDFSEFDLVFLGFWVYRGKPDPRMLRIMQSLHGKKVAVFGTLAAYPDSAHALRVLETAKNALQQNTYLGDFLCLGKLTAKRLAEKMAQCGNTQLAKGQVLRQSHPMTEERKQRLLEGQQHPNSEDLQNFRSFFEQTVTKAAERSTKQ